MYGYFKQQTNKIAQEQAGTWLRGNFKMETESVLITAQNNAIRSNYIKAKMIMCRRITCIGKRDETVNHISECS